MDGKIDNHVSESVFRKIVRWQANGKPERIVPVLVGETGSGKTARIEQILADPAFAGRPIWRPFLPGTLPDEIMGLPRHRHGSVEFVPFSRLTIMTKHPGIIFLDELSHAPADTLSCLLTLIYQLRVQDLVLHPATIIVAAMQPVDRETWLANRATEALSARCCFLPLTYDWGYVEQSVSLSGLTDTFAPIVRHVELPTTTATPRTVALAVQIARETRMTRDEITVLCRGLMIREHADSLASLLHSSACGVDLLAIADISIEKGIEAIDSLTIDELPRAIATLAVNGQRRHLPLYVRVLERAWRQGRAAVAACLEAQYKALENSLQPDGTVEFLGDSTPEDLESALGDLFERVKAIEDELRTHPQQTQPTSTAKKRNKKS